MNRRSGPGGVEQLSLLARGHGLLGGGVEVECFANDRKAFTLMGQPILKPSSYGAPTVKPYRAHQLALPTTYVTRRGQMVLFTAPEDMIIGASCHMHEREVTSQSAAQQLKTTRNLVNSALNYSGTHNSVSPDPNVHTQCVSEDVAMPTGVKAGHFTNVYLNSLQKLSKSTNQNANDCAVEDIEVKPGSPENRKVSSSTEVLLPGDSEVPLASECDSGLGRSITPSPSPGGRISVQSHISDASSFSLINSGHVIRVPDGRDDVSAQSSSEWTKGPSQTTPTTAKLDGTHPSRGPSDEDTLSSLRKELGLQQTDTNLQTAVPTSKKKSTTKPGKKRHHPKASCSTDPHADSKTMSERKTKKKNGLHSDKTTKSKRRRTRNKSDTNNKHQNQDPDMEIEQGLESGMQNLVDNESTRENLEITAVQLAQFDRGEGAKGMKDSLAIQRSRQAEERRREIERKRAEKRELERRKREEEEKRLQLQEEIDSTLSNDTLTEAVSDNQDVLAAHGVVTVGQKVLRTNLEELKLKHSRFLLSLQGEELNKQLSDDISSAQEAIERARAAQARGGGTRQGVPKEVERENETESCKRCAKQSSKTEAYSGKAVKFPPKESVKSLNPVPPNERQLDYISGKNYFSYFRYVPPPPKPKVEKKGKRNKRPKGMRSK